MRHLSVIKTVPGMIFIIISILVIITLIYLASQQNPEYCFTDLNATSDVILLNVKNCVNICWKRHDFGNDIETEDCYLMDVFIQDKDLITEDFEKYFPRNSFVKIYFDDLKSLSQQKIKIRYNATGKEISLVKVE